MDNVDSFRRASLDFFEKPWIIELWRDADETSCGPKPIELRLEAVAGATGKDQPESLGCADCATRRRAFPCWNIEPVIESTKLVFFSR